jgi:hypothetical protein
MGRKDPVREIVDVCLFVGDEEEKREFRSVIAR